MRKIFIKILTFFSRQKFRKNSILGDNVLIGHGAKIINASGSGERVVLDDHVSFHGTIEISRGGEIHIGKHSTIRFATVLESAEKITIGEAVIISNNVIISDNDSHPTDPGIRQAMCMGDHDGNAWSWDHAKSAPVVIEDNVWIGRRAMIMKGVTIGRGSIIASGAVVTKNIPPYSLAFGNPCAIRVGLYKKDV